MFLFSTASTSALEPTIRAFPQGVKQSGREIDHPSPSSAEVENAWSYTFIPRKY
jgi:hypothetical protein